MLSKRELTKIRKVVVAEFPDDPALQQVHIARKTLGREAELRGLTFPDYIKLLRKPNHRSRSRRAG